MTTVTNARERVFASLAALGEDELRRRREETVRLLAEDGVTYHVHGDDTAAGRRWHLDPVPDIIDAQQWRSLELGIVQRAELLSLVLEDLYGPRSLLKQGLLPAELVLAHPGFLRPCDGVRLPGPRQLFSVAFDLVRGAGGSATVLADRTQAPSGAAYALENRRVTSRVLPVLYRDAQVQRLAPYFRALRAGLERVAPHGTSDPRIVVLSPGSRNETAFEHAALATHLGYSLVQGPDLTVREGRVWLRALGALEPVHVVLRRVDAAFCDPLELYGGSRLGVPGLVEATRRGGVAVVNSLGSGALENPGLLPFMDRLARHLLGQPLRLPAAPTWWCGEEPARQHVLARLERLVLKRSARDATSVSLLGWELSHRQRDELAAAIAGRPHQWVGQEPLEGDTVLALTDQGLQRRRAVLRTFVVAGEDGYVALPGALTRVAGADGGLLISQQRGASAKDTWVLSSEPEPTSGHWLSDRPVVHATDPVASMPARAAENLFWMGRYAERAENTLRMLRAVEDRRTEFEQAANPAGPACVDALLIAATHLTTTFPGFTEPSLRRAPGAELVRLAVDAASPGTLAYAVRRLVDAAEAVRDQLSSDTWIILTELQSALLDEPQTPVTVPTLQGILRDLLALAGLADETMVRDPGWRFMDAGRRIERALQLLALLQATLTSSAGTATDSLLLESVLVVAESIVTYRRRYRSHAHHETVLDLLLLDASNPRSLLATLERLAEDLAALPAGAGPRRGPAFAKPVADGLTALRVADTAALAQRDRDGGRPQLATFLAHLQQQLRDAADLVASAHFSPRPSQRSLDAA